MLRNGTAADGAEPVLFFATGSHFITGQILPVLRGQSDDLYVGINVYFIFAFEGCAAWLLHGRIRNLRRRFLAAISQLWPMSLGVKVERDKWQ